VIKIVVDGQRYAYSADDIAFLVAEAARAGAKVAAHVQTDRGAHAAIEDGPRTSRVAAGSAASSCRAKAQTLPHSGETPTPA
jgi:imidazolonepropionase-like amidohydrolase